MDVAVLLATYNGSPFLKKQLESLAENTTSFTLHWIDDRSTDDSREVVRLVSKTSGIRVKEWHQQEHLGVPSAFFRLLELVVADVYLFCDQDDIWQAGKIDALVEILTSDVSLPVLCCSDSLLFRDDDLNQSYHYSEVARIDPNIALQESRLFMSQFVNGHSQAFTRALRDIFMKHSDIAHTYASLHDEWMHVIAMACGEVRLTSSVPMTLYRWHRRNASNAYSGWTGKGKGYIRTDWHQRQNIRRAIARHARGFLLAAPTIPPGERRTRAVNIAELVATIDRRQSPVRLIDLTRRRVLFPNTADALKLCITCLLSDARA